MKPGYKTTEFWVNLGIAIVGVGVASGYLTPDQSAALTDVMGEAGTTVSDVITKAGGWIASIMAVFNYTKSRTEVKK